MHSPRRDLLFRLLIMDPVTFSRLPTRFFSPPSFFDVLSTKNFYIFKFPNSPKIFRGQGTPLLVLFPYQIFFFFRINLSFENIYSNWPIYPAHNKHPFKILFVFNHHGVYLKFKITNIHTQIQRKKRKKILRLSFIIAFFCPIKKKKNETKSSKIREDEQHVSLHVSITIAHSFSPVFPFSFFFFSRIRRKFRISSRRAS